MVSVKPETILGTLTPREYDILRLLNEGLSDRQMAERLVVTLSTIKWYNHQIYGKLAVSNRVQAINRVQELGLLQPGYRPSLPATTPLTHNLRVETTQFIGRQREINTLKDLLQGVRLLTLTGSPGTGKTRLSLRVGMEVLPDFAQGVFFIDLAPVDDAALLPLAIADGLGLKEKTTEPIVETLTHSLRNQALLLILDNYEQLLPEITLVADLLTTSPRLKILVTSREPLRLYGEQEYLVPPLELPDVNDSRLDTLAQCESITLFLQQARAVKPEFELNDENILDVAKICVRLDGLPLAIELAAAHCKLLGPGGLLKRLTNPLDVLVGGARNLATRQRTLRDTIDWSYNLLREDEKELFARLSIFAGGWTLEAVQAVCSEDLRLDPFEGLESLVDKSLVRQNEIDGEPRFMLLETLREYAREQSIASGGLEALRKRHAHYYIELAEQVEQRIECADQGSALAHLEREHDNFRAALSWSKSFNPELGLRFIVALGTYWRRGGHLLEGTRWSQSLLDVSKDVPSPMRAKALRSASLLASFLGDRQKGEQLSREALALARQTDDPIALALALHSFGLAHIRPHMTANDCDETNAVFDEALTLFRAHDSVLGIARCLTCKGEIARLQEKFEQAVVYNQQAASIFSQLGNASGSAVALTNLGWITLRLGNYRGAEGYFSDGLTLARQIRDISAMVGAVAGLAGLAAMCNQTDRAIRLFGAIETRQMMYGNQLFSADPLDYDICVAAARAQKDGALFDQLWEEGRNFTLETAITYVLADSELDHQGE